MKNIINKNNLPSPCWLLEEQLLKDNVSIFADIQKRSGAKILLALKGYALWKSFDILRPTLYGCCASGLYEAKLASEEFGGEVHTYSPAFKECDINEIATISHHMVFNSISQFNSYAQKAKNANPLISLGLRINPEYSESPTEMYNPCGLYSRLGTTLINFNDNILSNCDGFHFHALCEQDSSALEGVLDKFEEKFGKYIPKLKWVNFGGGHHITRDDYDIEKLINIINKFKNKYKNLDVYLEPGEAVGWRTGALHTTVLDIVHNGIDIAVLDSSAEAHMPDTILMPYRADVRYSGEANEKKYTYRLAGNTCLAGDIMGDYSFDEPLKIGDKIIFEDQMHYTMVKATTFNGVPLPSIAIKRENGEIEILKEFGYQDFKNRLS